MDLFSNFFQATFTSSISPPSTCLQTHDAIIKPLPSAYSHLNAVNINNNLAVIPGDWQSGDITTEFHSINPTEPCVSSSFSQIRDADFIAFDETFFSTIIGPGAQLERIQDFPVSAQNVHEAPVYLPETNELLYSDTSVTGHIFAINIDTHEVRKIHTQPPLHNVNGGTYHHGRIYLVTNGGPVRGIHALTLHNTNNTATTTPLLNNFRGRHFNSPNDLIFDSASPPNIYFTDPPYGPEAKWGGIAASIPSGPELPYSIYKFNTGTKAITTLSMNPIIGYPNGLAFSPDEKTLYVADSSSTSLGIGSRRGVYAFDVRQDGGLLDGPRLIHQLESGWADGVRVTKEGIVIVAVAGGVDFVDPKTGSFLGRISTPGDVIFNLEPARGKGVWLLTGRKHIYKATIMVEADDRAGEKGLSLMGWLSGRM